jgi:hypothetical protein
MDSGGHGLEGHGATLRREAQILCSVLVGLAWVLLAGCDLVNEITTTRIKDILDHPRKYENKEVTIFGTVTDGASLVFIKYFEVQDKTGAIRVVTGRVLPKRGEKIRVTGTMESIEIGPERLIVIREHDSTGSP